ncbi:hypothetical protein NL676_018745 [Syzygium grande]|nr:hypothetical protein NL676_018745 [Syzygium grande]
MGKSSGAGVRCLSTKIETFLPERKGANWERKKGKEAAVETETVEAAKRNASEDRHGENGGGGGPEMVNRYSGGRAGGRRKR